MNWVLRPWKSVYRTIPKSSQKLFLLRSIKFVLTKNYFWFNKKYYYQKFAPSYANLFMQNWEATLKLYRRYIDDCLIFWSGTKEQFHQFMNYMNENSFNLKFTSEIDEKSIVFLDLNIFLHEGRINNKTHLKTHRCKQLHRI